MSTSLIPVILAGGKGERFWPLSRRDRPKQFLSLDSSGTSLLQATAERLLAIAGGWSQLWVITAAPIADGVRAQLPELPEENLLIEPEGRDTAAAVTWATLEIAQRYGNEALVGFFPADHWIGDRPAYEQTLEAAAQVAQSQTAIVTLGIQPQRPATGYGYIEQGEMVGEFAGLSAYRVSRFTEKPARELAAEFLRSGHYSWNSGMFIFRAGVALEELTTYAAELVDALRTQGKAAYAQLPKISIDYALMEKTQFAYVLPAQFGWDDLGDWTALERLQSEPGDSSPQATSTDSAHNIITGSHIAQDTEGSILFASDAEQVIVTLGMKDTVVVRDGNVTLVIPKNRVQEIKQLLKKIAADPQSKSLL